MPSSIRFGIALVATGAFVVLAGVAAPSRAGDAAQPAASGNGKGDAGNNTAALLQRGTQLFSANGCGWCHEGGGRKAARGPQLMDTQRDDAFITHRITYGSPGRMPAFGKSLSPDDIKALIVYIRNLKPGQT